LHGKICRNNEKNSAQRTVFLLDKLEFFQNKQADFSCFLIENYRFVFSSNYSSFLRVLYNYKQMVFKRQEIFLRPPTLFCALSGKQASVGK